MLTLSTFNTDNKIKNDLVHVEQPYFSDSVRFLTDMADGSQLGIEQKVREKGQNFTSAGTSWSPT